MTKTATTNRTTLSQEDLDTLTQADLCRAEEARGEADLAVEAAAERQFEDPCWANWHALQEAKAASDRANTRYGRIRHALRARLIG